MIEFPAQTRTARITSARAALKAYAESEGVSGHEAMTGLITDVLHTAAEDGHDAGSMLNQAERHVTEEAEQTEAAHIVGATVRLRVVSYSIGMNTEDLEQALRFGVGALDLLVETEDETNAERIMPWVRVEELRTEERYCADDA
ncbi:hypothetical protein NE857_33825 (plasmid) [Nocardiopsis exhalans]|uniref:Uncharacterized protein n=1 Tax=Nocardiopsis exhalans TaxID=163604 RepID=A0ABY5DGZ2_9ACTN|nr:hypothetical protein [Nocardiopsis exhalans]USY23611.1 hypothetical protein NE857_33825 [Nocardiopsis exhalans]